MSRALRVSVPLNAMCSSMCDDAHQAARFVARSGVDPHTQHRAFELRHRIGDDGQAVGKSCYFRGHGLLELSLDMCADQGLVIGQNGELFHPLIEASKPLRKGRQ